VSVEKLQLMALPIFWPTTPLFDHWWWDCNLGLYYRTVTLPHHRR